MALLKRDAGMGFLKHVWGALCGGPLELILQHLSFEDCAALQEALLSQFLIDGRCYALADGLHNPEMSLAWQPKEAAAQGNLKALKYFRKYLSKNPNSASIEELIYEAAYAGQTEAMFQLLAWEAAEYQALDGASMLQALERGDFDLLRKGNGSLEALKGIACGGQEATLEAYEAGEKLGDSDYTWLLEMAAGANETDFMLVCKERGGRIGDALQIANSHLSEEAFNLCVAWGATQEDISNAMLQVIYDLSIGAERAQMCKDAGATNFNETLTKAAYANNTAVMELCKSWGATSYGQALIKTAPYVGSCDAARLCISWGVTTAELDAAINVATLWDNAPVLQLCMAARNQQA